MSNISDNVLRLVLSALPRRDGITPKKLHAEVDMWSLVTIRHALRILCDNGLAEYEGEPMHRVYRRVARA